MIAALLITLATLPPAVRHLNTVDVPALAPDEEFLFSNEAHHAGKYRFASDENARRRILQALRAPNRDDTLQRLIEPVTVAGEKWFDLRGITVNAGELDGASVLTRICWDGARFTDVDLTGA